MLHEVNFLSFNKRDEVQGWIYVPAVKPKGIVQIIHGFGEHSRRYLHMIVKFMDAGYIVAADDHVGHGKTAMVSGIWGDWGDAGFHTMMEDEHTLKKLVCGKYSDLKTFPLEKHSFEDVQLNFPKDIHGMLVNFYGDYMQMPPVEKRKTHYPYVLDFGDGINVAK